MSIKLYLTLSSTNTTEEELIMCKKDAQEQICWSIFHCFKDLDELCIYVKCKWWEGLYWESPLYVHTCLCACMCMHAYICNSWSSSKTSPLSACIYLCNNWSSSKTSLLSAGKYALYNSWPSSKTSMLSECKHAYVTAGQIARLHCWEITLEALRCM